MPGRSIQVGRGVLHDLEEANELLSMIEKSETVLLSKAGSRTLAGLTTGEVNKFTAHASCMIAKILTASGDHLSAVDDQQRLVDFEELAGAAVNLSCTQNQVLWMVGSHEETQPTGVQVAGSRTFDGDVQKLVASLQSRVPSDPLADVTARDLGSLHHARQISALLQTRALTSRLIPQLSQALSQAVGERYQRLHEDLEWDTDKGLVERLNNAANTLRIHSEYLSRLAWKPRNDVQKAMNKLHSSLHEDPQPDIVQRLHYNSALLACGKGPFGHNGRDEWSTLGESSRVRTTIQGLLTTFKGIKPEGFELHYEPSLDGNSGNNFVATVETMCTILGKFDPEKVEINAFEKEGKYPEVRKCFEEDESITSDERAERVGALDYVLELLCKNQKQLMVDSMQAARSVVDLQDALLQDYRLWRQDSDATQTRFIEGLSKDIESTRVRVERILKANQQADILQTTGDSLKPQSAATKKRSKKKNGKSFETASAQNNTDFRAWLTGTPYQDCNTLADIAVRTNAEEATLPSLENAETYAEADTESVVEWIDNLDISEATSQQSTTALSLTATSAGTTYGREKIQFGDMPTEGSDGRVSPS